MRAKGVDVSSHQGTAVDWSRLCNEEGVSFAILRASVGMRPDSTYQHNHQHAGAAGILRGSYHYLCPQYDARQQAQLFAESSLESELPAVLDVEADGLTEVHVRAFLEELERITRRPTMIYTSMYKWHQLMGTVTPWIADRPLWVAHYTTGSQPLLPDAWGEWTFWQFSETGRVAGYHNDIDLDYFNGDEAALLAVAGRADVDPNTCTDGFDFPVGPPDSERYYVAAGLAEQGYYDQFHAWHTGEDWNGIGLGDSDLGDPVYAVARGTVVAAGYHTPSWGHILLIEHILPNGDRVWSQYAHLKEQMTTAGEQVERGQQIGTMGKGHDDRWPAHLHFEIRYRDLPSDAWGFTRDEVLAWYAHPSEFIKSHRPQSIVVEITVGEEDAGFTRSDSRYWNESRIGHRNHSYWTYTMSTKEDCWAEWAVLLPHTGLYEVMAFIPAVNATSEQARYQITHRRGTSVAIVDQSRYFNQWVSLGQYPFSVAPAMRAVVRLSDQTGEPFTRERAGRKQVAFDAIRFVLLEKTDG